MRRLTRSEGPSLAVRLRIATGAVLLLLGGPSAADDSLTSSYFPLRVGNWWAYEEQDERGQALARETWMLVAAASGERDSEFDLRSLTKRLDGLGGRGQRWEGHEFVRNTAEGLRKRFPAGGGVASDMTLLKEPVRIGTSWHDAQGDCEVASGGWPCAGPRGELPDCVVIVCRAGRPARTTVTSTYARGIGMVRQDIDLIHFFPAFDAAGGFLPGDTTRGGHSLLRLIAYHVGRP
jgi:hypothetical protein